MTVRIRQNASASMGDGTKVDSGRGRLHFQLTAAFHRYGDGRPGIQPDRAEASPINPKKLVVSPVRTLCRTVSSLPSRIVTVAVKPDTSGTPGGTLSIAIRTGTRWARRTQV